VHDLFADSLAVEGYLVLGDKESIRFSKHASIYKSLSFLQKIYKRVK
jgi:chemotaxis protein methyltransferase CheR